MTVFIRDGWSVLERCPGF